MANVSVETAHQQTADGWRLALHRYRAEGTRRRHAVICCHGLAANRMAFDASPETSLARHLAARGYDVFVLELRGSGESERPTFRGEKRFGFAFDDYLLTDMPAAIEHARRRAGCDAVHWIGHSMGGILLYAHLAGGGSPSIRSGIAVAASLDYSASQSRFKRALPLRHLAAVIPALPIGGMSRVASAFVGRMSTPFERFNVWPSNVEPAIWRRISATGFHWVSTPVMVQLGSAMVRSGLRSRDGSVHYCDGLARATSPVLALAGDRDPQCPPDAARDTLDALGSPRRTLRVFGPEHGHRDHYGHFDMLVGRRAPSEVFPLIDAWLDEHDAAVGQNEGARSQVGEVK